MGKKTQFKFVLICKESFAPEVLHYYTSKFNFVNIILKYAQGYNNVRNVLFIL
jgi:hypothetical protein